MLEATEIWCTSTTKVEPAEFGPTTLTLTLSLALNP